MTGRLVRLEVWDSRAKNWLVLNLKFVQFVNGDLMIGYREFRLLVNGKEVFNTIKEKMV